MRGAYIWGPSGSGKTFVAAVMASFLAKRKYVGEAAPKGAHDKKVAFLSTIEMMGDLRREFREESDRPLDADAIAVADLLVIDDLGSETPRDWFVSGYLTRIVDRRNRPNMVTVFLSNFSLSELRSHYARSKDVSKNSVDRLITRISGLVKGNEMRMEGMFLGPFAAEEDM